MRNIDDIVDRAAREKVLITTGHTHNLVREDGADHQVHVRLGDQLVDLHVHRPVGEQALGQPLNLFRRDGAQGGNGIRVLPIMVEDLRLREAGLQLAGAHTQQLLDGSLLHRRVRTQGDQDGDGFRPVLEGVIGRLDHEACGPERVPSGITTTTFLSSTSACSIWARMKSRA